MTNADSANPLNILRRTRRIMERYAKYGLIFFLIKGLLWLIVPALIAVFFGAD